MQLSMIAAVVPLGLSPWFLECFSYKFDSPYMALSVLASVIPFIFGRRIFINSLVFQCWEFLLWIRLIRRHLEYI